MSKQECLSVCDYVSVFYKADMVTVGYHYHPYLSSSCLCDSKSVRNLADNFQMPTGLVSSYFSDWLNPYEPESSL